MKKNIFGIYCLVIIILTVSTAFAQCPSPEQLHEKEEVKLQQASPSWGKPIPGSTGSVTYYKHGIKGMWKGVVVLKNLKPSTRYAFSINGWADGRPGNKLLMEKYNTYKNKEGYYDYRPIKTDKKGHATVKFKVKLKSGEYQVKILIKDLDSKGWPVVLYDDHAQFWVY